MATWEDGPEYAPVDWPTGFVAPNIASLQASATTPSPSSEPPTQAPARFDQPRDPVPPLESLKPAPTQTRNPADPFQVATAVMTAGSAWESAHSTQATAAPASVAPWTPDQAVTSAYPPPQQLPGFPAPGTPEWFGPPAQYDAKNVRVPLTVGNVAEGFSWGIIITLVVGAAISFLSPILLIISVLIAQQVRYRRRIVRTGIIAAMALVAISGAVSLATTYDTEIAWGTMCSVSVWTCVLLLIFGFGVTAFAIRNGDRPED